MKNAAAKIDELAEQLKKDRGNVAATARRYGVSRTAIHNKIQRHPKLQQALAEARETMLDNAESMLYKKALDGSTPELIFFLKTQGKSRGYIEKQELDHSGEVSTRVIEGPKDVR